MFRPLVLILPIVSAHCELSTVDMNEGSESWAKNLLTFARAVLASLRLISQQEPLNAAENTYHHANYLNGQPGPNGAGHFMAPCSIAGNVRRGPQFSGLIPSVIRSRHGDTSDFNRFQVAARTSISIPGGLAPSAHAPERFDFVPRDR